MRLIFYIFLIQIGLAGIPYTTVKAFLIQIRGDICNKKLISRYQRYKESAYQYYRKWPIPHNVIRCSTDASTKRPQPVFILSIKSSLNDFIPDK